MHYRGHVPADTPSDFSAPPDFMMESETAIVVVTRVNLSEGEDLVTMRLCMDILANNPGCLGVELGRSMDSEVEHVLVSRWSNVGLYRKALSNYQVKVEVIPFISVRTSDSFTAEIVQVSGSGGSDSFSSGLASDAFSYERGNQS